MNPSRREGTFQWLAVMAAAVLGVLVVAGLMSTRLAHRGGVSLGAASAAATATATSRPAGDYGPAPAGVNLIWVHDPNHATWLMGYDWSGRPRGTLKLATPGKPNYPVRMSPDGQYLSIIEGDLPPAANGHYGPGGPFQVLDRLGRPVFSAPADTNPLYGLLWADDSRHACATTQDPVSSRQELWVADVGRGTTTVTQIARDQGLGRTPRYVLACSVLNDRVIEVPYGESATSDVWVLRLSDAKVLSHHTYKTGADMVIGASPDGDYISEIAATGRSTQIRRVSDWSVVTTLADTQVLRFSGDASRVFVTPIDSKGNTTRVADVDWRTGRAVWTVGKTVFVPDTNAIAEPGSPAFAVAIPTVWGQHYPADVTIVGGDGTTLDLGTYINAF
ncbi:MAG TPA: hypothetical protein VJT78_11930 [Candidatus Dormibacteraeota bacterium]|nr:hypothetical protein [Candidatus Dormibacteraeota bacterium]